MRMDDLIFGRPSRRTQPIIIIVFFLLLSVFSGLAQDQPVFEGLGGIDDAYKTYRSNSGRYVVISSNSAEALSLSRWIEEVAASFEKLIGRPLPFDRSNYFQVAMLPDKQTGGNADDFEIEERIVLDRKLWTLTLYDYYNLKRERAMEGLCGLFFASMMKTDAAGGAKTLPGWFVLGFSQNLYAVDKGKNSRMLRSRWQSGDMVSVQEIISADKPLQDMVACGAFVSWLLSFPSEKDIVNKLMNQVVTGDAVDKEWLERQLADDGSYSDIDANWDYWILGQKYKVYELGRLDVELVHELEAELLIYRSAYGKFLAADINRSLSFSDLIELKDEDWVSTECRTKISNIQLLGFGKAKEFREVTELYCEFLSALYQGKSSWRLKRMLRKADEALALLAGRLVGSGI